MERMRVIYALKQAIHCVKGNKQLHPDKKKVVIIELQSLLILAQDPSIAE